MLKVSIKMLAIFAAVFMSSGCDDSANNDEQNIQIVMGTSADMPPFEFYKGSDIVGYDIDVAKAIAVEIGIKLAVRDMDFSALVPALQSGRVDMVLASMTPTPERRQVIDFSKPYLTLPLVVITRDDVSIKSVADLASKKIGVQLGSTHEQFAKDLASKDKSISVHSLNKLAELIQELKIGRVDAVVMETKTAKSFQKMNENLQLVPLDERTVSFAVAFPKDSKWQEKVNASIEKLHIAGRFEEIRQKWFSN